MGNSNNMINVKVLIAFEGSGFGQNDEENRLAINV